MAMELARRGRIEDLERTCGDQRDRIAGLESQLPEQGLADKPHPFVGLKQLLSGRSNDGPDTPD